MEEANDMLCPICRKAELEMVVECGEIRFDDGRFRRIYGVVIQIVKDSKTILERHYDVCECPRCKIMVQVRNKESERIDLKA